MAIPSDERLPFPQIGTDPASVRQRVEVMEKLLERMFVIPGTKQSVGLDVILDLVPGIGDIAGAALGAYIVWEARNLGMSKWQIDAHGGQRRLRFPCLVSILRWSAPFPTLFFRSNSRT